MKGLLLTGLRGIEYDLKAYASALVECPSRASYLDVVLELLRAEDGAESAPNAWQGIVEQVAAAAEDPAEALKVLERIADFMSATPDPRAGELAGAVLARMEHVDVIHQAVEEVILPRSGYEAVKLMLEQLARWNRRRAVRILSAVARSEDGSLSAVVRSCLTSLAKDPLLLAVWAMNDPTCVSGPGVSNIIQKSRPERLLEAFRRVFAESSEEHCSTLLGSTRSGIDGTEQILLAAVLFGSPATRRRAIELLPNYPTRMVVEVLRDLVVRNNSEAFCLAEVEAALDALRGINDPAVRAFLQDVVRARKWLRPVYRKEIRRMLLAGGNR